MTLADPTLLLLALFPAGVIVAALKDATSFTIPNWISGLIAAAFFPTALAAHLTLGAVELCLAAGGAALVAGIAMFALRWCGGGDAKLLAASALWLGWQGMAPFLLITGIAGGLLAAGLITARKNVLAGYAHAGPSWLERLLTPGADLPYGLAIAAGALAAFPSSILFEALSRR